MLGRCYLLARLRIAKVKTSLLGPIDSTWTTASSRQRRLRRRRRPVHPLEPRRSTLSREGGSGHRHRYWQGVTAGRARGGALKELTPEASGKSTLAVIQPGADPRTVRHVSSSPTTEESDGISPQAQPQPEAEMGLLYPSAGGVYGVCGPVRGCSSSGLRSRSALSRSVWRCLLQRASSPGPSLARCAVLCLR